jgi:hypothetical protein
MTDKQATIFGTKEPVAPHPSDVVECSDGTECSRLEALVDCRGGYHRTEEDRHEADVAIVTEVLDAEAKWCEDYCTENEDYADGYFCIVSEGSHRWDDPVKEWVEDNVDELIGPADFDNCDYPVDELVAIICDELDAGYDCEVKYNCDSYGRYYGPGCCLDGFKIEEYETQVDINGRPELEVLHDAGRLDDVLDDVNCDLYISRSCRREKNEETGHYENVGRKTYMPYERDYEYPHFLGYVSISGGWDFVVPNERMEELLCKAIVKWAGYDD